MPSVHNKTELFGLLKDQQARIRAFGVVRLGVFGSFVSGNVTAQSDIDFYVTFREGLKTYKNFMGLAFFLEELTGRKIELLTEASLSAYIGPKIKQEVVDVIAA